MRATVTVDVDPKYTRTALRMAGFDVNNKSDQEICEMAIRMNDCYAVKTENIILEEIIHVSRFQPKKEIKNKEE